LCVFRAAEWACWQGTVQVTIAVSQRRPDRARRLPSVERDFDANEDLAGLVIDLADEVRCLRRLHVLG
jgi:hypothetical protein